MSAERTTINQKIVQIGTVCIKWMGFLITGVLFTYSLFRTTWIFTDNEYTERAVVLNDSVWQNVLGLSILLVFICILINSKWWKRISICKIHIAAISFFILVGSLYVFMSKNQPSTDQLTVSQAAVQALKGDYHLFGESTFKDVHIN